MDRPVHCRTRRFSLSDAMVLIAALGLGLMVSRGFIRSSSAFDSVAREWLITRSAGPWFWAYACVPPLLAVSAVLFPLRLIPPRPRLLRLLRLPGLVPSYAAWLAVAVALTKALLNHLSPQRTFFSNLGFLRLSDLVSLRTIAAKDLMGPTVAAWWLILWLGGAWRAERSWIDRAGRLLGIVWIVFGAVNWFARILFR